MRLDELEAPIEEFQSSCIGVYLPDAPNLWDLLTYMKGEKWENGHMNKGKCI